jgi:hypothetical protein
MVPIGELKWSWNGQTLLITQHRPFYDEQLGHENAEIWSVYLNREEAKELLDSLKEWLDAD